MKSSPRGPCGEQGLRFRANIPKPTQGRGPRRQLRSPSSPKTLVRGVNCKACLFSLIQLGRCRRVRKVRCVYLFVFLVMILQKNRAWLFRLFRPAIELCIVASVLVPRSPPIRPCLPPWMSNPLFKEGTVGCDEAACFPYLSFLNFL